MLTEEPTIPARDAWSHVHASEGTAFAHHPMNLGLIVKITVRRAAALEGCSHRRMSPHVSSSFVVRSLSHADIVAHRTIQTAVLIETLTALGAEVTWSSCVSSYLQTRNLARF